MPNQAPLIKAGPTSTSSIVRVSTDAAGNQANGTSYFPVFSPDGSKIAFEGNSSNLVAGDTIGGVGSTDILVKDLITGAITRVSVNGAGEKSNSDSGYPAFSPDGSKIAFQSSATNLVAGDTNGVSDIFIKDLATGAVTRVSTDAANGESNSNSFKPTVYL